MIFSDPYTFYIMTKTFYLCQALHMAVNRKKKHKNCKSRMNRWCQASSIHLDLSQNQGCSATCRSYKTYQRVPQPKFCVTGGDDLMGKDPWNNFTQLPFRLQFSISWCHVHPLIGSKDEEGCGFCRIMFGVSSFLRPGSLEGSIGSGA